MTQLSLFSLDTFTLIRYAPLMRENQELKKKVDHLNHVKAGYKSRFSKKRKH